MVTPDEVDDHLGSEVKEECSQKYGPVRNCIIYKVVSHPEAIRIFVEFENVQDADRGTLSPHCHVLLKRFVSRSGCGSKRTIFWWTKSTRG